MENVKFARIDHRLIHGQVITKWMKIVEATRIVIVDDNLGQDPFMVDIYQMAAPAGVKVEIVATDKVIELLNQEDHANERVFLLFKSVGMVKRAVENGLELKDLQLGGVPFEPGRTKVASAVALLPEEFDFLKEIHDNGTNVYIQIVPEEAKVTFDEIAKKF